VLVRNAGIRCGHEDLLLRFYHQCVQNCDLCTWL
jgi:hypothetical protein